MRLEKSKKIHVAAAILLVTATILTTFLSFRMVSARESHLRALMTKSVQAGTWKDSTHFELESGTLVTVQKATNADPVIRIHWQSAFAAFGDTAAWIAILGLPAMLTIFLATSFSIARIAVLGPLYRENKKLAVQAAATRSMQMFAHDVRKPFSAVKAVIQVLQNNDAPEDAANIARRLLPEIDSLLVHVDQMIADVLQNDDNGSAGAAVSLDIALEAAVRETSRKHPQATHKIAWNLQQSQKIAVSGPALTRAIANLLCNAIEAMSSNDTVWIHANDIAQSGIGITVGNSGPVIPKDVLSRLFTPFYTSGKEGGTGLGLSYVQSVVEGAGGIISVSSDPDAGTQFRMNLPASRQIDKPTIRLPERFNETKKAEHRTIRTGTAAAPLRILIVDDNHCYADAIIAAAHQHISEGICEFLHASAAPEALLLLSEGIDIVICDIDLGPDSENGITVIQAANRLANKPAIYVHSNATLSNAEKAVIDRATDGFLAKPVATPALAALICRHQDCATAVSKPVVAIIDDDCFVRELWSLQSNEITPVLFDSPDNFFKAVDANPEFLASLDAVIVDYYFDNCPDYTGDMLATAVRKQRNMPVIMSSDASGLPEETTDAFDLVIPKDCMSWESIAPRVRLPA